MRFINKSDPGLERYIRSRSLLLYGRVQFVIEQWDTTCFVLYGLVWFFISFDFIQGYSDGYLIFIEINLSLLLHYKTR